MARKLSGLRKNAVHKKDAIIDEQSSNVFFLQFSNCELFGHLHVSLGSNKIMFCETSSESAFSKLFRA